MPDAVAMQMADIFSSDIDFHRDLQRGDKFTVVYEAFYNKGELVKTGHMLAAEFINSGKATAPCISRTAKATAATTQPEGKNLRKAFLRSPLEFSRITSGFTNARYHPVLKEWRAHKGVDYGAPTGTRVKATADGSVDFVGQAGRLWQPDRTATPGQIQTVYGHFPPLPEACTKAAKSARAMSSAMSA